MSCEATPGKRFLAGGLLYIDGHKKGSKGRGKTNEDKLSSGDSGSDRKVMKGLALSPPWPTPRLALQAVLDSLALPPTPKGGAYGKAALSAVAQTEEALGPDTLWLWTPQLPWTHIRAGWGRGELGQRRGHRLHPMGPTAPCLSPSGAS